MGFKTRKEKFKFFSNFFSSKKMGGVGRRRLFRFLLQLVVPLQGYLGTWLA